MWDEQKENVSTIRTENYDSHVLYCSKMYMQMCVIIRKFGNTGVVCETSVIYKIFGFY